MMSWSGKGRGPASSLLVLLLLLLLLLLSVFASCSFALRASSAFFLPSGCQLEWAVFPLVAVAVASGVPSGLVAPGTGAVATATATPLPLPAPPLLAPPLGYFCLCTWTT